jgi:hypothetical protein
VNSGSHRAPTRITLLVVVAVVAGLTVSPALGGPGFLTVQKAKRVFFTKKKTNRLFLRKSAALTQADGDARYPQRHGTMRVQVGPDNWVQGSNTATVDYAPFLVSMQSTGAANTQRFHASPQLPSEVGGEPVRIESFELCYDATAPSAEIDGMALLRQTTTGPSDTHDTLATDTTVRNDKACAIVPVASSPALGANSVVQVLLEVDYSAAGAVRVSRLTLNLSY